MSKKINSNDFDNQFRGEKITMKQEKFELVSAYIDGELTALQRREVEVLLDKDPVARHLYQRLLQLHYEFERMPITSQNLDTVDRTVEEVFEKIDRRSRRTVILGGSAIAALAIAVISGIISATRSPVTQLADVSNSEPVQIALNEPVIEIVNPNNVILTVNEPLFEIPQPSVKPLENK
ncbi:transcriptional regulator [Okeania sp.]|uniref:anti-sigma factor family protein n=1 Tax=Okeania sp. TaxID=3100323 RepID=UPI002B4AD162|nr:transcriptional regulator [Okeania sp.]MEB3342943.1 transcriptional regulator [Okeania sp.]